MTIQELLILSPIIFVALGALVAILLEITTRNVSHVIYVTIVFLILSFLASMNLWNGWTNTPNGSPILGDSFSVDHFAIFFYFLIIPVGAATLLMIKTLLDKMDFDRGEMIILLLLSLTGMMALVSSRDLLAIYVSLELASLPLIALGAIRKNGYALEVGVKFLVMSSVSTATLLYGFVILYGLTGSTNLDQILYELKNMDSLTPALMFSISLLTTIRIAWKVRVAGCVPLLRLEPRALLTADANCPVVCKGRRETIARAILLDIRSSPKPYMKSAKSDSFA